MNHEHPSTRNHPAPKHRAETGPALLDYGQSAATGEVITDPKADAFVAEVIENAPSPEAADAISRAYQRHGTAFAIYLTLDGVDKYVHDYGPGHQPADPRQSNATSPAATTAAMPTGTRWSTTSSRPSAGSRSSTSSSLAAQICRWLSPSTARLSTSSRATTTT